MNKGWQINPTIRSVMLRKTKNVLDAVCSDLVFHIVIRKALFPMIVINIGPISNASMIHRRYGILAELLVSGSLKDLGQKYVGVRYCLLPLILATQRD